MNKIIDKIIADKGTTVDAVIPILQAIQEEFNHLPSEALHYVCDNTNISLARIYGIINSHGSFNMAGSTFYSQFRHKPVGKHIIKVCVGTACHVKGAMRVYDAFKRELNIDEADDTDADGVFTVDKVACLGCCTIAPVVQIDNTTFGHVEPSKVENILDEFLNSDGDSESEGNIVIGNNKENEGEIRIGLGSCCVASGSSDVKSELEKSLKENKTNVDVKQVGCVGICNQVPLLEIHKNGESPYYYTKIVPDEVNDIIRKHFRSKNLLTRMKTELQGYISNYVLNGRPVSTNKYSSENTDTPVAEFLDGQINIATEFRGEIKPDDLEEYKRLGGTEGLRKALTELTPDDIISTIQDSGLRGRGGGGFMTGVKWDLVKNTNSDKKYVICNGDEGDPGAFMDFQ